MIIWSGRGIFWIAAAFFGIFAGLCIFNAFDIPIFNGEHQKWSLPIILWCIFGTTFLFTSTLARSSDHTLFFIPVHFCSILLGIGAVLSTIASATNMFPATSSHATTEMATKAGKSGQIVKKQLPSASQSVASSPTVRQSSTYKQGIWTDISGRQMTASFVGLSKDDPSLARFTKDDGVEYAFPLEKLCAEDQERIRNALGN
jgi:hypothetical protein